MERFVSSESPEVLVIGFIAKHLWRFHGLKAVLLRHDKWLAASFTLRPASFSHLLPRKFSLSVVRL